MTGLPEAPAIPDVSPNAPASQISILRGNPSPEELAAVTAVIAAMLEEFEDGGADESTRRVSAWQRSQRPIRAPLSPGFGAWRGFSG